MATTRRSMIDRMKGAAMLSPSTYEEVENDPTATGQAAIIVVLGAIATAIGAAGLGLTGLFAVSVSALVGWLLVAGVMYLIGDKLLGGTATWGELMRTIGFAHTPRLFLVLAGIPVIGGIVAFLVAIWLLVAFIVAIRHALDVGTGKAIVTAVLGWIALALLNVVAANLAGVI
ncbi:MAG TPA: YIP1 family protein [Gemmatimonadaceae bacterium]|nr:YIP1 family protein [Gemmatimonadaceae bacterium]